MGSESQLKNQLDIGLLINTGPDLQENHKAIKPAFMLGHYRHASETLLKWRFGGGPKTVRF